MKANVAAENAVFRSDSWSRPGFGGSHCYQHLPRARLEEIVRCQLKRPTWGTLLETPKVLGQPGLVGTKGYYRQEHVSMGISSLGLGFSLSRDIVVILLRDDGAL